MRRDVFTLILSERKSVMLFSNWQPEHNHIFFPKKWRAKDITDKLSRKEQIFARGPDHCSNFWKPENTPVNQKMKTLEERYILQDYKFIYFYTRHKKVRQQSWQQVQKGPAGLRKRGSFAAKSSFFPLLFWQKWCGRRAMGRRFGFYWAERSWMKQCESLRRSRIVFSYEYSCTIQFPVHRKLLDYEKLLWTL